MEVMSYLLLCTVFFFQQGLGKHMRTLKDITPNNSIYIQKPNAASSVVMLNLNEAPRSKTSGLQMILGDVTCDRCKVCMEKAIREQKQDKTFLFNPINTRYDILSNDLNRHRRDITVKDEVLESKKEKKHKSKKNKVHKTVTVTKYTVDGVVSVLKVKENFEKDDSHSSKTTCEVYNVNKSYACASAEGELAINQAKRKSSKKGKKEKTTTTTEASTVDEVSSPTVILTPSYRKREAPRDIDPEIITSIEDY